RVAACAPPPLRCARSTDRSGGSKLPCHPLICRPPAIGSAKGAERRSGESRHSPRGRRSDRLLPVRALASRSKPRWKCKSTFAGFEPLGSSEGRPQTEKYLPARKLPRLKAQRTCGARRTGSPARTRYGDHERGPVDQITEIDAHRPDRCCVPHANAERM